MRIVFAALPPLNSSSPLLLSFSTLHFSILPSSCSTPYLVLPHLPYPFHTVLSCLLSALLFTTTPSVPHVFAPLPHADTLLSIVCAPPSIYKHTQGQNCTNLGILALVSLPVKLLFLHIRPRQECRDIYETLFNVLKSHRLEHLGN